MFVVDNVGVTTVCYTVPIPGHKFQGGTVVASSYTGGEDEFAIILVLEDIKPYYRVCEISLVTYKEIWFTRYENIVPASQEYQEVSGCW